MTTATILSLIAFALTQAPVVIADIQKLVAAAQAIHGGQTPTEEQAALVQAVADCKAAVDAAKSA